MKGRGCWEGRAGFGSSCANLCHEIWLGQLLAELIKCCSSASAGILRCLCTGDVLSRALLHPQRPLKCFKQTLSCRIHCSQSLLLNICAFSMGQLCLCVLKPLYFITFAARSWLCDTIPESRSVVCTHLLTEQGSSHPISLFPGDVSGNVSLPEWCVES